jgi:hypothetical protein
LTDSKENLKQKPGKEIRERAFQSQSIAGIIEDFTESFLI